MKQITSRLLGLLFITPLFAYGLGDYYLSKEPALGQTLILVNSLLVILIGLTFLPYLKTLNKKVANTYLIARVLEGVLLAIGLLFSNSFHLTYQLAMLILALGSIILFQLLHRKGILPSLLSIWAILGYSLLAIGSFLELTGLSVGVMLSLVGGLFELSFGIYLLFFAQPFSDTTQRLGSNSYIAS